MKQISRRLMQAILITGAAFFLLPGCYESHYYHHNHHHTRGWYDHRHREYPAGVDFNVDVHDRRR